MDEVGMVFGCNRKDWRCWDLIRLGIKGSDWTELVRSARIAEEIVGLDDVLII